jgi:2-phospho-L-lactate guanylyltransferase
MRTAAILPVKRFSQAKQRLSADVADPLRRDLARAMVGDVLAALGACTTIDLTIVVTSEPSVATAARAQGAIVEHDAAERGQSAAVALGLRRALAEGAQRALCIPGDCPALDPDELDALLAHTPADSQAGAPAAGTPAADTPAVGAPFADAPGAREVAIVPDRHGTGTNGLLLVPPDAIAPSFGPGSCERHRELARGAGVTWRLEHPPSLLLDIDTGADLAALRERLMGQGARAQRTRRVLGLVDEPWPACTPAA